MTSVVLVHSVPVKLHNLKGLVDTEVDDKVETMGAVSDAKLANDDSASEDDQLLPGEASTDDDADSVDQEADDDEMAAEIDSGMFGWKRDKNGVWTKDGDSD